MSDIFYSFQIAERDAKRSGFRIRRPNSPYDLVFGFAARLAMGLLAVFVPVLPVLLWGALNGWAVTSAMVWFYGVMVFALVLLGEHFRSRIFERVLRVPVRQTHVEITGQFIRGAISPASPSQDASVLGASSSVKRRVIDLIFVIPLLFLLFPLFNVIACFSLLEASGPVFYVSKRYDIAGREVRMVRFRVKNKSGHFTPLGRFLRATSLEELPLLFNVLTGSLGLIGARPRFNNPIPIENSQKLKAVLTAKPGILDPYVPSLRKWSETDLDGYVAELEDFERNWTPYVHLRLMYTNAFDVLISLKKI
jgi:lipopolysaccharide/colanic/teichoic acid biosynthesis glycosyltransferase